jgi:hypothetical protein
MVGQAFGIGDSPPPKKQFVAIWDTGATSSVISAKVVKECGLKPIGMAKCHGASGEFNTEVFLISVTLPNRVSGRSLRVTMGTLTGADMLIGMDLIGLGDFAVTNLGGKTTFSFRIPSCERIDFTQPQQSQPETPSNQPTPHAPQPTTPRVGRNDPCPCGSGKKFKKCCLNKSPT